MTQSELLQRRSRDQWVDVLTCMMRIRAFESKVEELFKAGRIPGFTHLYIGEEAIAAGVCAALRRDDWITSTHRGHGHAIAKGARTDRMMAELFGKRTGYCAGKGGSMHIADFTVGMLGANGVVGGGFGIAVGAALSAKMRGTDQVAVAFAGDGATNRGTFHEALNFASIFKLPAIFVIENNGFASTTPAHYAVSVERIAVRAAAYAMPGVSVDGTDAPAVYEAAAEAVGRARRGEGPSLIEAVTFRWRGHYIGDPELYRDRDTARTAPDPIARLSTALLDAGMIRAEDIEAIRSDLGREIEAAVQFATDSPYPEPQEALSHLFVAESEQSYA